MAPLRIQNGQSWKPKSAATLNPAAERLLNRTMLNRLWGELIIDELARCGCRAVWICPGARSAPLATAAVRSTHLQTSTCIDERAASYQAVNAARVSGAPAVVICTSGTAAANLLPAAVEAALSSIPLVLLTADRPPELRDTGANQTIDQPDLFGRVVAWRFDLPVPDDRITASTVLTIVDQAVYRARSAEAPVHLNCMFAEPLLDNETTSAIDRGTGRRPYTSYATAPNDPPIESVVETAIAVRSATDGVLAIGPLPITVDRTVIADLASTLGWPVLADIQSGLRPAWVNQPPIKIICHHDLVLAHAGTALPCPVGRTSSY